jgi:hypothetical protein
VGPTTQSVVVAGVVRTWVMRCGWPSSQVSVVTHFEIRFSYGQHFTGIRILYDGNAQAIK